MWRNTNDGWGMVSILLHWTLAILIIGLFILGWWMTGLGYYDPWYNLGPWWHRSLGMLVLFATLLRLGWRLVNPTPRALGGPLERAIAHLGHLGLYVLMLVVLVSGYLISTADGKGIAVFDWFTVPAVISGLPNQASVAGEVHWYAALALMILSAGHAVAALKHHLVDRNPVLRRMIDPHAGRR
ncbi:MULTISPECIES: cytochrome b [Halomonas]|uniref:Cytochrome b n=2 Tax=Halomonas TaxID=2745 RepID=A0A7X4VWL4_9GAMM|nr:MULTISPECIES: cytochrome b [Halomonas]MDR5903079.1 cytochrome b [Halomonas icarae]NAW11635.1 cytochrome b [Halomonas icarae]TDB02922.1 cytochrome b [Halomonas marinisediminis]